MNDGEMSSTATNVIKLSPTQALFALMIEPFPRLSAYWNWEHRTCDTEALDDAMGIMSHGERILAQFFLSLWTHNSRGFDMFEAASVLDQEWRQVIVDWLADPF